MSDAETLAKVAAVLPTLQDMATKLHNDACVRLTKDVAQTVCIVDASDASIAECRIDAGDVPVIRLSAVWVLDCVFNQRTELIVDAIRRGVVIAHKRLRWTLGKNKPRIAAEYVSHVRGYRIANEGKFSLPIGHFRTTLTVTLTDPMTGETVTKDNVRPEDMEHARRELALSLTAKVYAHTQAAEILDTLEAHKLAVQESAPTSVSLIVGPQSYALETVHYDNINTDTVDIHAMPEMP